MPCCGYMTGVLSVAIKYLPAIRIMLDVIFGERILQYVFTVNCTVKAGDLKESDGSAFFYLSLFVHRAADPLAFCAARRLRRRSSPLPVHEVDIYGALGSALPHSRISSVLIRFFALSRCHAFRHGREDKKNNYCLLPGFEIRNLPSTGTLE